MVRVFVPGVFDVFHIGHLNYLMAAAEEGDELIVGVQDDREVESAKGVPLVHPLAERIAIIEQLKCVDEVISYIDVFQGPLLEALEIDVFACGEEYGKDERFPVQRDTLAYCAENGIRVAHIPRTPEVSSTRVRSRLKEFWASRAAKDADLPAGVTVLGSFGGDQDKVSEETRREVELVLSSVEKPANCRLLDAACGDGRLLVHLASQFDHAVGIDYVGDLLSIAERRLDGAGLKAELFEADVTQFEYEGQFDVILLSGILPCLDDQQCRLMIEKLSDWASPNCKLLVRSSVGIEKRINVVNQYSSELKTRYTGYYRTVEETTALFTSIGWQQVEMMQLYQHREDTAVWWFDFTRN